MRIVSVSGFRLGGKEKAMAVFRMMPNRKDGPTENCGYCGEDGQVWSVATRSGSDRPDQDGEANICPNCNKKSLRELQAAFVVQRPLRERGPAPMVRNYRKA
jgi:hypothetical protein